MHKIGHENIRQFATNKNIKARKRTSMRRFF